jgi:hypothetical protein
MLASRPVAKVNPDEEITADDRNYLAAEIQKRDPLPGPGIKADRGPDGVVISAIAYEGMLGALIPSGGILACSSDGATQPTFTPGSASCQIYVFSNLKWKYAGYSRTVYNDMTSGPVAGSKLVQVTPSGDGALHATGEPC